MLNERKTKPSIPITNRGLAIPGDLTTLLATNFKDFLQQWSSNGAVRGFEFNHGLFPFSTETEYAEALPSLTTKGGIHLAVAGGLDPVLGQIGQTQPDITVLCEVNTLAEHFTHRRLAMLDRVEEGRHYWQLIGKEFDKDREVFRFGLPIPIDRDYRNGGWFFPHYFPII